MVSDLGLAKSDHVIMPYTAFTDEEGHWKGRITLEKCLLENKNYLLNRGIWYASLGFQ